MDAFNRGCNDFFFFHTVNNAGDQNEKKLYLYIVVWNNIIGVEMIGAVVFVIAFLIFLGMTLNFGVFPPGDTLYKLLNVPETSYPVLGYPATLFVKAVFNGVVYGFIVWLVFSLAMTIRRKRKEKRKTEQAESKVDEEIKKSEPEFTR